MDHDYDFLAYSTGFTGMEYTPEQEDYDNRLSTSMRSDASRNPKRRWK